jgi:hypothetical protein
VAVVVVTGVAAAVALTPTVRRGYRESNRQK